MPGIPWQYDDGGRADAGYRGDAGDCTTRSIAIATRQPYQVVYQALRAYAGKTPRDGVPRPVLRKYLADLGWQWHPTMQIGSGCTVHLAPGELPGGRLIASLSRHLCAVVDGVVRDTYDPSRAGTRCVYGYWQPPAEGGTMSTEELTLTQRLDRGATLETLAEEEGVTVRTIKRRLKAEADGQPAEAQPAAASRGLSDRQALILGALRGAGGGPISTASIAGSLNLGAGQVADAAWYLERKSPPLIQRQNTGLPEGERARFGWVLTDAGNAALDTASQG